MLGLNIPVPLVSVGDHVPPISGVPPKLLNKSTAVSVLQKLIDPSVPASLVEDKETSTVAVLKPQELVTI